MNYVSSEGREIAFYFDIDLVAKKAILSRTTKMSLITR